MSRGGFTSNGIILVGGGPPPLSIENNGNSGATVAGGTTTYSILGFVVTSANLLLIAVGSNDANSATNGVVSSVVWNGQNATLVSAASQVWPRMELWKLVSPVPGTHDIVITLSGPVNEYCAGATGFIGANATLGTPTVQTSAGANPATVTFASAIGEIAYACCTSEENIAMTPDGTSLFEIDAVNSDSCYGAQWKPGAASVTANWTQAISRDYASIGVSVKPA